MKTYRRLICTLLCILLTVSMIPTAFAAEEDDLSAYVYHHNVADDDYDGPNLQYFSPYVTDYTFDGNPTYIQNNIFSMYNTLNGEVIPVYCTDIEVGALPDHRYRRLNLEDSTYAASAAGHLRAILRNGFYVVPISGESDADHAARVAENIRQLGEAAGVEGLTIGEAISGTQSAIWQAAHGARLVYTDFVRTIYTAKVPSATRYYELCNEERDNGHINYTVSSYGKVTVDPENDAWINSRIKAVYNYLLSLEPVSATQQVVSAASFTRVSDPVATDNGNGTYDLTVTTTVDVSLTGSDHLTLTADLDDTYTASKALTDGAQTVTLTLEDVPAAIADDDVSLSITGMQTASEVFLYDAYGDRETAQSMIGMDDSQVPVFASVLATDDRILSFVKTTLDSDGTNNYNKQPLEGIIFDIYYVASLNDYNSGAVSLPDAKDYDYPDTADHVVITDAEGRASVNFTQQGLSDGIYLVVERDHPAIKAPVDPFYVFMPTTNTDGTGLEYEVTVYPKNEVKGEVAIDKDVISLGNDSAGVNAYEDHTWIISTDIPEDIAQSKSFAISDTLDNRLDYKGNLKVTVETTDGQTVLATLTQGTDYILTVSDQDSMSDGKPSDAFSVSLLRSGMTKIAQSIADGNFSDYKLRVYFDAQVNANAEIAQQIPNQATLDYTNSVNFDFSVESDKPVVYTGGVNLLKVDSSNSNRVLSGATFEVYRYATADEVTAADPRITHIQGVSGAVIQVPFFTSPDLTGEKVTSVTSDEQGKVRIYGRAYGEYFLLETHAPTGYNRLGDAAKLTIDANSHLEENVVSIKNVGGSILPSTGGMGTTMFYIGGSLLLCAAAILLLTRKKTEYA